MDRLTLVLYFSSAMVILHSSSAALAADPVALPPAVDSCSSIVSNVTPCLNYLRKREDKPSKGCCDGAEKLNDQVKTKEDKVNACNCIKKALTPINGVDASRIPEIPKQCGIDTTLPPIDRNFDCSTISSVPYAGMIN